MSGLLAGSPLHAQDRRRCHETSSLRAVTVSAALSSIFAEFSLQFGRDLVDGRPENRLFLSRLTDILLTSETAVTCTCQPKDVSLCVQELPGLCPTSCWPELDQDTYSELF
ncbi:hypothetical protein GN956_G16928 [Arapaima gigas]